MRACAKSTGSNRFEPILANTERHHEPGFEYISIPHLSSLLLADHSQLSRHSAETLQTMTRSLRTGSPRFTVSEHTQSHQDIEADFTRTVRHCGLLQFLSNPESSQRCVICSASLPYRSKNSNGCVDVRSYTDPFLSFITDNPTVFHAVASVCDRLESSGFTKLSERDSWTGKLSKGGKYFFERNGSSVIAFVVGKNYKSGNGASVIASHIDALTTRLKPIPTLSNKAGYVQLGVAPYAGALNNTWWDRDLGIGGRVLIKEEGSGKIKSKLVKLGWPIARIPTLAPHFGAAANLSNANLETQMVPIIGLDQTTTEEEESHKVRDARPLGGPGAFTATQPERLVKAIAGELNIQDCKF